MKMYDTMHVTKFKLIITNYQRTAQAFYYKKSMKRKLASLVLLMNGGGSARAREVRGTCALVDPNLGTIV